MSERYLRYYAPTHKEDRHEKWKTLLSEIQSKHGIEWKEEPTASARGGIHYDWYSKSPETDEQEVWENELTRNQAITQNDPKGQRPSEKFKANSGNFHVQGTIAVVDPEHGVIHGERHGSGTEFLETVAENGEEVLSQLAATGKQGKSVHGQLVDTYAERAVGQTFREYSVGESLAENEDYSRNQQRIAKNIVAKNVDLVVKGDSKTELVEAKGKFKSDQVEKALGQLLLYEDLYGLEHPDEEVELKAIFPEPSFGLFGDVPMVGADEAINSLLRIFESHEIEVQFMDDEGQFRTV